MSLLNHLDFKCPICLCLLIKPVQTPCKHEMCLSCFETNIENANFSCPICRIRISSWARKAIREKRLVDKAKWQQIQKSFPNKVKLRLAGIDESYSEEEEPVQTNVSADGEIKKEFEEFLRKFQDEWEKEQELEDRESTALIRKLQEEDQCLIQEQIKVDQAKAIHLQKSFTSQDTITEDENMKHIEELSPDFQNERVNIRSSSVESHDSISSEMCHFKPINAAPCTPPKQLPDGRWVEPLVVHSVARHIDLSSNSASNSPHHNKVQKQLLKGKSSKNFRRESATSTTSDEEDLNLGFRHKAKSTRNRSYKENYPLERKRTETEASSQATSQVPKNIFSKNGFSKGGDSCKANCVKSEMEMNGQSTSHGGQKNTGSQKQRVTKNGEIPKTNSTIYLKGKTKRIETDFSSQSTSHSSKGQKPTELEPFNCWERDAAKKPRVGEVYSLNQYEAATNHYRVKKAQEEADHLLAMKLQAEFDSAVDNVTQRTVDRTRGSGNEYSFRKRKV